MYTLKEAYNLLFNPSVTVSVSKPKRSRRSTRIKRVKKFNMKNHHMKRSKRSGKFVSR